MEEEIEIISPGTDTIVRHKHKHIHEYEKETEMTPAETVNLFGMGSGMGGGTGAAIGGGLGAGVLGGVLGGILLNPNRLGGGVDGAGVVTPAMLTSGLASVIDSNQNTTLLQSVGDLKAAVPLAEANTQLAISVAQAELAGQINNSQIANLTGQALINKNISDAIASSLASQSAIKETVASYGVANLNATNEAKYATGVAIANSTKEILAAINGNEIANLQRQLTVSESRALEDRLTARGRETEVTVTQTVNQNQLALQQQQQSQSQSILLNGIWHQLANLQQATATNSQLIVGNAGAVAAGPQSANPINVRT